MEAGRELDALVAERVMGISLLPSRDRQKAVVGWRRFRASSPDYGLEFDGEITIDTPDARVLPTPPSDCAWNDRYMIWCIDNVLNKSGELDDEIAAVRNTPQQYSVVVSLAWEVVIKLRELGFSTTIDVYPFSLNTVIVGKPEPDYFRTSLAVPLDEVPYAICIAALKAVGYEVEDETTV